MAVSQITVDISELEGQRLGYNGVSLNNWTDTLVDAYDAGSKFECGGAIYQVTADEVMGTVGEWGGIANSTLVYSYFDPSAIDFHFTSTAPTWSGSKQGYYGTGGAATYRYLASIYKDGSGNYTQKTILLSREHGITYQGVCLISQTSGGSHVSIASDGTQLVIDKNINDVKSYYAIAAGAGTLIKSTSGSLNVEFYIKKPILVYITKTGLNYDTDLDILQNSVWTNIIGTSGAGTITGGYGTFIGPGYYRLTSGNAGTTINLYCTSVYGASEILASEIVT